MCRNNEQIFERTLFAEFFICPCHVRNFLGTSKAHESDWATLTIIKAGIIIYICERLLFAAGCVFIALDSIHLRKLTSLHCSTDADEWKSETFIYRLRLFHCFINLSQVELLNISKIISFVFVTSIFLHLR